MKKALTVLLVFACFTTVLAGWSGWSGWGGIQPNTQYSGDGWSFDNGTFTFSSQFIWTDFAARVDPKASGSLAATNLSLNDIVEFGYYKIENGVPGNTNVMFHRDSNGNFDITNSVIFNKGESIGIYAKIRESQEVGHYEYSVKSNGKRVVYTSDSDKGYYDNRGEWHYSSKGKWVSDGEETVVNTYTTTEGAIEGASTVINNVDHDSIGQETQYFCLFLESFSAVDHFEYYLAHVITGDNYDNINDFINEVVIPANEGGSTITDSNGNPVGSGQPLPGLLLTLSFGGAIATGLCKARKRKISTQA